MKAMAECWIRIADRDFTLLKASCFFVHSQHDLYMLASPIHSYMLICTSILETGWLMRNKPGSITAGQRAGRPGY